MEKLTKKQILRDYPGLALTPRPKPKVGNAMRRRVCDFAQDHELVIHPGRGYEYYIESFNMFGCCPCDETRKSCPCPEAINDVASKGHCLCHLFWRDLETFKQAVIKEEA